VVYRQINIDDDDLLALSRMMGTLVVQPTGEHKHPEIQTITLDPTKTNALLASFRQGNFHWHIDGATDELPQKGTLLTAREVDPAGGDTEFATTYAAYEALSEGEKDEIDALRVVHSFAHAQSLANPDPTAQERRLGPGSHTGSPAGLAAPQRPQVSAAGRDRVRSRGLARRQGQGVARTIAGLVHPSRSSPCGTSGTAVIW
jgi:Taurine catabolism dioxygenase TauD, TfdA family